MDGILRMASAKARPTTPRTNRNRAGLEGDMVRQSANEVAFLQVDGWISGGGP